MPAANRGVVGRPAPAGTSTTSGNYLNNLMSSYATLQAGLSIFAIFVILRHCVRRCSSWLTRADATTTHLTNSSQPSDLIFDHHKQHFVPLLLQPPPSFLQYYGSAPAMDEKRRTKNVGPGRRSQHVSFGEGQEEQQDVEASVGKKKHRLALSPSWNRHGDGEPKQLISRPPPAPPLTPPEISTAVFTLEDHRPSTQDSFMHQPNPDYTSSTATSISQPELASSPLKPRRRSYNKTLPIGIPRHPSSASESDAADLTTSPSSYPPTSPLLPPPPTGLYSYGRVEEADGKGTGGQAAASALSRNDIDIQGEIVSVLNRDGAGWTRHTRVYGGGVCLACAAAGGEDGGFYGATVRPDEMR